MDRKSLFERLDKLGEEAVRLNIASNVYGPENVTAVNQWLAYKATQREAAAAVVAANSEARKDAANREQIEIARSAKNAAWAAATAAIIAAICAMVSIGVSLSMRHP